MKSASANNSESAEVTLQLDGAYYHTLLDAIKGAKRRIWVHQFSFNMHAVADGALLVRSVARALIVANARGVDVRLICGGDSRYLTAQPSGNDVALVFLSLAGLDVREFKGKGLSGSHAKYVLVDDAFCLVGSHNWSPRALGQGHDCTLATKSPSVNAQMSKLFSVAWRTATKPTVHPEIASLARGASFLVSESVVKSWVTRPAVTKSVSSSGAVDVLADRQYHRQLLKALGAATKSIDVSMFYFSYSTAKRHPNAAIVRELLKAKSRGCKIRIVLDRDRPGDLYNSRRINEIAKKKLEKEGIAVAFDAPDVVNHTKFVAIDGATVLLGSHNWTRSSQERLHEVSLKVGSAPIAKACSEIVAAQF